MNPPAQHCIDPHSPMPQHIAIIMDGNRRWAKHHGLPSLEGHRQGVKALHRTSEALRDLGIRYLTVYAFSTENKNRPPEEITGLMHLICYSIKKQMNDIHANGICLKFIGMREGLNAKVLAMVESAEARTANNSKFFMTIALNYGSQADIALTAQRLALQVNAGEIMPADITPELITRNLSTAHIPLPDILIRTSGEKRISNFLLWEISYT
ncbi:MAG: di-trans,poly-cis-decaprenylcistransferase, partial [Alphaproteobacteria bacterium]|nr:di-trans,poly-cis-decaprenylcistransferase [Alphaproteobacteria bacterium]